MTYSGDIRAARDAATDAYIDHLFAGYQAQLDAAQVSLHSANDTIATQDQTITALRTEIEVITHSVLPPDHPLPTPTPTPTPATEADK